MLPIHCYRLCNSVNGAVSLNAAIFAAVLLASRLPSSAHVFVFVALAIQLFALFPILRDFLRVRSEIAHLILTGALFVGTLGLLMTSSTLLAFVFGSSSEYDQRYIILTTYRIHVICCPMLQLFL